MTIIRWAFWVVMAVNIAAILAFTGGKQWANLPYEVVRPGPL